jgi:hypothetical protein
MKRVVGLLMPAIALASVLGVGVTIAASGPPADLTRQVGGGGVTVAATLLKDRTESTSIQVALATHSVNLDPYHFDAIAVLRDDQGKAYPLEAVEKSTGAGHHRSAVLRFARVGADAKAVELMVKGVAGVKERTFRWTTTD